MKQKSKHLTKKVGGLPIKKKVILAFATLLVVVGAALIYFTKYSADGSEADKAKVMSNIGGWVSVGMKYISKKNVTNPKFYIAKDTTTVVKDIKYKVIIRDKKTKQPVNGKMLLVKGTSYGKICYSADTVDHPNGGCLTDNQDFSTLSMDSEPFTDDIDSSERGRLNLTSTTNRGVVSSSALRKPVYFFSFMVNARPKVSNSPQEMRIWRYDKIKIYSYETNNKLLGQGTINPGLDYTNNAAKARTAAQNLQGKIFYIDIDSSKAE